jgi:hypothetical protein
MSWLFSRVLVEEYLGDICLDGEQFAPLSGNPTQLAYCAPDKMTDFSRLSRFGMTYKPLTVSRGEDLLTLYLEDSRARTSQQREKAMGLTGPDQECGSKWQGSFVKYDQDSSLWRTHQCSFLGDLEPFSEIWPQWGLMRNGECWEQTLSEPLINAKESGLLPTPLADDWKGGTTTVHSKTGRARTDQLRHWCKIKFGLTYPIPEHSEAMMGYPVGWTDLKPLVTDKSLCAPQQPGSY